MARFEVKYGKFGAYFYDTVDKKEMGLQDVVNWMNLAEKTMNLLPQGGR